MNSLKISHDEWRRRKVAHFNQEYAKTEKELETKKRKSDIINEVAVTLLFSGILFAIIWFMVMWMTAPEQWYAGDHNYKQLVKEACK